MTDIKQLEDKLKINEHALDIALREHPDLFYQVANQLALSISRRDADKQALVEAEASVAIELRAKAVKFDEKVTEGSITAQVKSDKRIVKANEDYLSAHYEAAKWAALKEAYESRSYALSKLVDLYIANYYSTNESKQASSGTNLKDVRANQVREQNRNRRVNP